MIRTDIVKGYTDFTLTYADLTAAASSQEIQLLFNPPASPISIVTPQPFQLYAGSVMLGVRIIASTAFRGGSLSAMTVSVGASGDSTRFAAAFDIYQAVGPTVLQETAEFKSGSSLAIPVTVTFSATGDNVRAVTAGLVDIFLYYIPVPTTWV